MSLPVPDAFLTIVALGSPGSYSCPGVTAEGDLALEPGEAVRGSFHGEFRGPLGILSETTSIVATSYRCAWIDPRFTEGASWAQAHAGVTSRPSPREQRGAKAGQGRVAAGHVRHEWVLAVRLRKHHDPTGVVNSYVEVVSLSAQGSRTLTGYFPEQAPADEATSVLVKAVSERWLAEGAELLSSAARLRMREYARGDEGALVEPDVMEWQMPGLDASTALTQRLSARAG